MTDTNFGMRSDSRGPESQGWVFWVGSRFSWSGSITWLDLKALIILFLLVKKDPGSPWLGVAIEIHKKLPLDTPTQIPVEGKVMGDHVFDILEHCSQTKEYTWDWQVVPKYTKVGGQKGELSTSNF